MEEEAERKKIEEHLSKEQKAELKSAYTKESRRQMYMEMAADKEKKDRQKNPEKYKVEKEP